MQLFVLAKKIHEPHLWLCVCLLFAAVPHFLRVPLWISLLFITLIGWRLYLETRLPASRSAPGLARQAVLLVIVSGVLVTYGTLVGRDAGVALLLCWPV